jgi:flagellar L-ring protein precursor FlgH
MKSIIHFASIIGISFCIFGSAIHASLADTLSSQRPNGSLWSSTSQSITADFRAHRVGDTITIVVQESSTASSTANTKTSKTDSVTFGGLTGRLGSLTKLLNNVGGSDSSSLDGQGQTNRTGSLVTTLTATIKQIMPNGNLMIEGTREVTVNSERQKITLSGTIRPQDIQPNNSVSSIALADAVIKYDGKGPVGDKQHRGLLSRIFGWLF